MEHLRVPNLMSLYNHEIPEIPEKDNIVMV